MLESTRPFDVVCIYDPAIDSELSEVLEYGRERDISKLKFRDGMKPVKFTVERMNRRVMLRYICAAETDNERYLRAFACGVSRVTGLPDAPDWRAENFVEGVAGRFRLITDEELERFEVADILEIGAVAYWRSFLRQGSAVTYPLLQSSARVYDMTMQGAFQSAEGSEGD